MNRFVANRVPSFGPACIASLVAHLLMFALLTHLDVFKRVHINDAPVYYVDLLNLPVAAPQGGNPGAATVPSQPQATVAPQPAPAPTPEMKLPAKTPDKTAPIAKPAPNKAESEREFQERMARLERDAGARHEAAALDALKKKVAANAAGKVTAGIPGATGKQAGSDYAGYIRSRLEDAFRKEDTFRRDGAKMVAVRLVISPLGRINTIWVDRTSGDKMFNDAVMRAIRRAENEFKPPPDGLQLELSFVFKPQGVGRK